MDDNERGAAKRIADNIRGLADSVTAAGIGGGTALAFALRRLALDAEELAGCGRTMVLMLDENDPPDPYAPMPLEWLGVIGAAIQVGRLEGIVMAKPDSKRLGDAYLEGARDTLAKALGMVRESSKSPEPGLAQVDPDYLRHLRALERRAIEAGWTNPTEWELFPIRSAQAENLGRLFVAKAIALERCEFCELEPEDGKVRHNDRCPVKVVQWLVEDLARLREWPRAVGTTWRCLFCEERWGMDRTIPDVCPSCDSREIVPDVFGRTPSTNPAENVNTPNAEQGDR